MTETPVTTSGGQTRQVVTRGRNRVSDCFCCGGYGLYDLYDLKEKKMEKGGYRERWNQVASAVKVATVVTEAVDCTPTPTAAAWDARRQRDWMARGGCP